MAYILEEPNGCNRHTPIRRLGKDFAIKRHRIPSLVSLPPWQASAGVAVSDFARKLAQLEGPAVEERDVGQRPPDADGDVRLPIVRQDSRDAEGRVGGRVVDVDSQQVHIG